MVPPRPTRPVPDGAERRTDLRFIPPALAVRLGARLGRGSEGDGFRRQAKVSDEMCQSAERLSKLVNQGCTRIVRIYRIVNSRFGYSGPESA